MKWTTDDIEKALKLVEDKKTNKEIGEILGKTAASVKRKLQRTGLKRKSSPLGKEKRNCKCFNKEFNVNVSNPKIFCSQSCSATYTNKTTEPKRKRAYSNCINCNTSLRSNETANKFCSNQCQSDHDHLVYIKRWKNNEELGYVGKMLRVSNHIKRYIIKKCNDSCQICGFNQPHPKDGKSLLHLHHIDGNAKNCNEENLQLLCPNCHAMTENFGARNKNSARIRPTY
jgi:hypothetical protein